MRKAMIYASLVLAIFQLWPFVFGRGAARVAAPMPHPTLAIASAADLPRISAIRAPQSCYRQYRAKFAACGPVDEACHIGAADQWDQCEATGLWPQ